MLLFWSLLPKHSSLNRLSAISLVSKKDTLTDYHIIISDAAMKCHPVTLAFPFIDNV